MALNSLDAIVQAAKTQTSGVMAVAAAHDTAVIEAVTAARRAGIVIPVLVGHTDEITKMLTDVGENPADYEIIPAESDVDCAKTAVRLVTEGKAHFLMKGIVGTPDLMRAVAVLLERGLEIPKVYNAVYNSYSASRVKLLGYSLGRKMEVLAKGKAAYISLTEKEMRRHNFQLGDSEGFVNYPLTIAGMKMSALFTEPRNFIRVSLRSRGDEVDVNIFARRYFGGGGHKNAAGGKSFVSIEETVELYKKAVEEFFKENNI